MSNNYGDSYEGEGSIFLLKNVSLVIEGRQVLSGICWEVKRGERWILFGRNGSGKSSLLHILSGYQMATEGEIWRFGEADGQSDLRVLRSRIGLVNSWMKEAMHPAERVLDAVMSGIYGWVGMYALPQEEEVRQASYWLEMVQMEQFSTRLFGSLSDGEKMRVLIARAMMAKPEMLILDEPCSHLDILSREVLLLSLERIAQNHPEVSMIMVTHHTEEILPLFDKIHILCSGKMFYQGRVEEGLTSSYLSEALGVRVEIIRPYGRYICLVKSDGLSYLSY